MLLIKFHIPKHYAVLYLFKKAPSDLQTILNNYLSAPSLLSLIICCKYQLHVPPALSGLLLHSLAYMQHSVMAS